MTVITSLSHRVLPMALVLVVPVGGLMMPLTPQGTATYASIVIFGIPSEAVEPLVGSDIPVANFVDVHVEGRWWTGIEFAKSLKGRVVESGNRYHIGASDIPGYFPTPEDMLEDEKTDIRFPLKVVDVRWDPITLVYETPKGPFTTYFATVPQRDQEGNEHGPGVISDHKGRWIGRYVLENGVMARTSDGWTPWPIAENVQVRMNGSLYNCSLAYVYYFPWAH